jgi:hypothetical protein
MIKQQTENLNPIFSIYNKDRQRLRLYDPPVDTNHQHYNYANKEISGVKNSDGK